MARKKIKNKQRPQFSLAFYIAIFSNFLIGGFALISFLFLLRNYIIEEEIWSSFALGIVASLGIIATRKMPKFRTFIHELKHFFAVVFSGNKVKDFQFDTHTGHVEFAMYSNKVHFGPFIAMAPYFLPLFSFPVLIACFIFEEWNKPLLCGLLGITLAADISMAYKEIHPYQTDFKKIFGGFPICAFYLAGFHFMWTSLCLLWVLGGVDGYLYALYLMIELGESLIA